MSHPLADAQPVPDASPSRGDELVATYGHFAGEKLTPDYTDDDSSSLTDIEKLKREAQASSPNHVQGTSGVIRAIFLLTKAFVGTGILFLPKAFLNGGMVFSIVVMIVVAALSLWTYLLLVRARECCEGGGSFGDIAEHLYGKKMRFLVQSSISLSQLGFVCAYIIFIAENLRSFVLQASNCSLHLSVGGFIAIQVIIFIPFSFIRRIERLGFTTIIAEIFILFGLGYIYYYDFKTIMEKGISTTVQAFNPNDFALFIGTAVYSFEGIGLVIPITEAMREPKKFTIVLWVTLVVVTILFTSVGAISYAAFGSDVGTMIVMNLPQTDPLVISIRLIYALAIVLSVPLQLFPAITILEKGSFGPSRSGRVSLKWKWSKNLFRGFLVLVCMAISLVGANDLDKFVSLIGSFACIPLCFIYPPLFHWKKAAKTKFQKCCDIGLGVFGVTVMVYATYITIEQWVRGSIAEPEVCIPR